MGSGEGFLIIKFFHVILIIPITVSNFLKEAEQRIIDGNRIDAHIQAQICLDKQFWRYILQRILTCNKFLVSENFALRGHEENLSAD